jgi:hypothetical protein
METRSLSREPTPAFYIDNHTCSQVRIHASGRCPRGWLRCRGWAVPSLASMQPGWRPSAEEQHLAADAKFILAPPCMFHT